MSEPPPAAPEPQPAQPSPPPSPPPRAPASELRLRQERPSVTKISSKVLIAVSSMAGLTVAGLGVWALHASQKVAVKPQVNTDSRNLAEGLGTLPKDYAGMAKGAPQLGPPLPGDLGRPILAAQAKGMTDAATVSPPAPAPNGDTPASAVAQQKQQAVATARASQLFVTAPTPQAIASLEKPDAAMTPVAGAAATAGVDDKTPVDPTRSQNMQDRKLAFLGAGPQQPPENANRLIPPASPYVVQAGAVIAAALVTGIRSDLPGEVSAQVTAPVYDSPTGRFLLIPQGARLLGQYDSQVAFAQSRVQLVWTRLILPNGQSVVLDRQVGADTQGLSGLQDGVDNHWGGVVKAALLSTLLSVGAEAGTSDSENNLAQALRAGAANSFSQAGQQIVSRGLNVQPTLTIRPGFPVRVIVNRDLILQPYIG